MFAIVLASVLGIASVAAPATNDAPCVSAAQFFSGAFDTRRVTLRGTVRDAFDDEVDPRYIYFVMLSDGLPVYAAARKEGLPHGGLDWLIGAEIEVSGFCNPRLESPRRYIGRNLQVDDNRSFRILRPANDDPFDAPSAEALRDCRPEEMRHLGRHLVHGRVVAVWDRASVLVKSMDRGCCYARLEHAPAPACGDVVDISGFPSTDHYSLHLAHAVWRPSAARGPRADEVRTVTGREFFSNPDNRPSHWHLSNGQPLRLRGIVRSVPTGDKDGRLYVECDGHLIPIDRGTLERPFDALELGSEVEVTAIAAVDTGDTSVTTLLPRIRGIFLILRDAADLRVLATPSPVTPARLLALAGILAVLLVIAFVWNAVLQRLASRRARELLAAQIKTVKATLKAEERTRLAVELHDSVSQNLTGVSMEIEAAARCRDSDPEGVFRHLGIADKALKSCRHELRNEIWDLRNQALEETDMASAIRTALQPHLKGVSLEVDFGMSRRNLTDNSAHEILKLVRELVLNAIRHGGATAVRVSGEPVGNELHVAVTDNGRGFDPAAAPGVTDGHFGLQGVRERLRAFKGQLTIESAPGRGATARAVLRLPENKETER